MSSKREDGGHAFPREFPGSAGMTLRDYFAAKAMAALLSDPNELPEIAGDEGIDQFYEQTARAAYELADAMLAERSK